MKTYVNVSFLIILIFQRFDFIIQSFDGKRSKQKRKVNFLLQPAYIYWVKNKYFVGIYNNCSLLLRIIDIYTYFDSFHLCLFDFPFIYQFYSTMNTLVKPTCWNSADLFIFKSFHQHFKRIEYGVLLNREMQLLLLSLLW